MDKLFQTRLKKHVLMLMKYWKLVFNDHFIIALFFMFGALAYGYSQALNQIKAPVWWGKPVILVILLLVIQLGRLATMIEKPDPVFLLPQTKQINRYLQHAKNYSLLMAELIMIAGVGVLSPFMAVGGGIKTTTIILIAVTAVLMKAIWMNWTLLSLYDRKWQRGSSIVIIKWLVPVLLYVVALYVSPLLALILSIIGLGYLIWQVAKTQSSHVLDWRTAVVDEANRMQKNYRFFNLFTDVPLVQGTVHRRRYLDWLIKLLGDQKSTYGYLFSRGLIRGADISGLIVRLTIVGMLIVFFIPQGWLNVVIFALFIYLVSVQLVSLYSQFDNSVFVYIYPVTNIEKQIQFKRIVTKVLSIVTLCLLISSLTENPDWIMMGIKLIIGLVEIGLISTVYLKSRIQSKA